MMEAYGNSWTAEFLDFLRNQIPSWLSPENLSLVGKLGTHVYGIHVSLTKLQNIDEVEKVLRDKDYQNQDRIMMIVKNCNFSVTTEKEIIDHCQPSWLPAFLTYSHNNEKALLKMLQDEREFLANKQLGSSTISSGIAIYFQYLAIQAVIKQIEQAGCVAKDSQETLVQLRGMITELEEQAEKLMLEIQRCPNDSGEICPKLVNKILRQTNRLILKQNEIAMKLSELKLQAKNGITTLKASATSQRTAMKMNLVQGGFNLAQHMSVGTSAHPFMQVVFGLQTGGYFAAAYKNCDNRICCENTLASLTQILGTIEGLSQLVREIQVHLDEADRIMQRYE